MIFLGGRNDSGTGDCLLEGVGDGLLMQGSERGNIGIVPRCDLDRVADGEPCHVPFGLEIPERLVRFTEPGQAQIQRSTRVIGNGVARGPCIDGRARMANAVDDLTGLVIDPQAIAGIMGGLDSSVTDDTQDIFLESAFFAPLAIAGRARRFGLHTDSSQRYERGVDFELPMIAMHRASELIQALLVESLAQLQ